MKEYVLDTETTGLDPSNGHRMVEIGVVELENHKPTGKTFHEYINPLREVPDEVVKVHGLTTSFLSDKPTFPEVAQKLLDFIGNDTLVIHNASFDMRFLNYELEQGGFALLSDDNVIDTLSLARRKFPGMHVNLDELCRRFRIDNSHRTQHGALLDSELLAEVYENLLAGEEESFFKTEKLVSLEKLNTGSVRPVRQFEICAEDFENHKRFLSEEALEFLYHLKAL